MTWAFGQLAAFDTESTAPDPTVARLVTATVAQVIPGAETVVTNHLVAVTEEIPAEATAIHGVTTEHAQANGKPVAEVVEAVTAHLAELLANGIPLVGMNVAYDLTLIDRECRRNGIVPLVDRLNGRIAPVIDVFVIDKNVDRYRKGGRKLTDLCAHYGVRLDGAHDATADALGAARVAYRMCQRSQMDMAGLQALYRDRARQAPHIAAGFVSLGQMGAMDLHAAQVGWYRAQSESLAAYFLQQAAEAQDTADRTEDDDKRDLAANEVRELRQRAEGVSLVWPMAPFGAVSE